VCAQGAPNLRTLYKRFCVKMLYRYTSIYQSSHSYENLNVPRNYRILCDVSSYEEPTFATIDQTVEWPKRLVSTTSKHHKQARYSHHDRLCLSEEIPAEAVSGSWLIWLTIPCISKDFNIWLTIPCISQDFSILSYWIYARFPEWMELWAFGVLSCNLQILKFSGPYDADR
jgi:hypothetical protein